jgi:plasmid maintenance system antidote protein VapI
MKTKKLSQQHSSEDLSDDIIYPVTITLAQKKEAAKQLAAARKISQKEITENDRISLQLFQLKFQLEDYIENKEFNPDLTFGHFLKQYVNLLQVKRKDFADQISIDETLLSQFINMHRMPPEYIAIRLEIHSYNTIPATDWLRLVGKQREHELKTDKEIRRKENKFVHRKLAVNF